MDHGHNVWAAEAIKKVVSVPVIASGSINTPELAEEVIASGKGDFVGLGRPLWADPEWPKKAEADHPEDIRPCIRCNEGCLERTFYSVSYTHLAEPVSLDAGLEEALRELGISPTEYEACLLYTSRCV